MWIRTKVNQITPVRSFESKRSDGRTETINVMGMILKRGSESFYGEVFGEKLKMIEGIAPGDHITLELKNTVRTWRNQQGGDMYENRLTVTDIMEVEHTEKPF